VNVACRYIPRTPDDPMWLFTVALINWQRRLVDVVSKALAIQGDLDAVTLPAIGLQNRYRVTPSAPYKPEGLCPSWVRYR